MQIDTDQFGIELAAAGEEQVHFAAAQQAHRNYAKRQLTWFRREPDVLWLKGFGNDPEIQEKAIAAIAEQM